MKLPIKRGYSTTARDQMMNDWIINTEIRNEHELSDLSAAFNVVDHELSWKELSLFSSIQSAVHWVKIYLTAVLYADD